MLRFLLFAITTSSAIIVNAGNIEKMNQFREFRLTQGEIYTVKVKKGDGVTTVTFPSEISKLAGVNVASDNSGDFLIAAKAGSYYFNLVALKPKASGTLTVVFNRKTYILHLVHDENEAYSAVNFTGAGGGGRTISSGGKVTPARLLSLIDLSKAYDLMMLRYPHELQDSIRAKNHRIFEFEKFKIELLEVIRYNTDDTLVFKVLMHNPTAEEIPYDKFSFSVRVAGKPYHMSAADASGIMPPKSATWAFFAVTGTTTGGRNNLAPDNDFIIGVTCRYMENELIIRTNEQHENTPQIETPSTENHSGPEEALETPTNEISVEEVGE